MNKAFISTLITLFISVAGYSQIAPRPEGRPGDGRPPRDGQMRPDGDMQGPPQHDWLKAVDTNKDGKVDADEFNAALDATFTEIDKNSNGMIDANEMPRPPRGPEGPGMRHEGPPMDGGRPQGPPPNGMGMQGPPLMGRDKAPGDHDDKKMLPPFFFADRMDRQASISRADFDRIAHGVFNHMDKDGDGSLSREESRPPRRPDGPPEGIAPPPNGQFIAAELRFGDRLVKGQPFSAETVIEDTRRLYDGTTVTKASHGAFYRDSAGRTRREQPLEMVGGVSISGSDGKQQMLVFINDFAANEQYFLDVNNKVARRHPLDVGGGMPGPPHPEKDANETTESLGTKTIDGVQVEGTRITFEIPAGHIGNDKPIQVVTENWFSPELQMMVLSRHTDPIAGEHIFKLTNIKRAEQSADLFTVPTGFKVEGGRQPRSEDK